MSVRENLLEHINSCSHIFTKWYFEPSTNQLEIVVQEAKIQKNTQNKSSSKNEALDKLMQNSIPIEVRSGYREFRILFDSYIVYSVINESFANGQPHEDTSKKIQIYDKSAFLDFVAKATFATSNYPGPYLHYYIVCEDHIFDVASCKPPKITCGLVTRSI